MSCQIFTDTIAAVTAAMEYAGDRATSISLKRGVGHPVDLQFKRNGGLLN